MKTSHIVLVALVFVAAIPTQGEEARRPNIIYIFTDQQSASMMSCTGNPWLKTPAVDYLAANGIRFERAYTTNPKCVPARVGMITGRFPGEFGVRRSDSFRDVDGRTGYARNNIGAQLKRAGYNLAYGGKVHLPEELDPEALGFEVISTDRKRELAEDCAEVHQTFTRANRITWLRHSSTRTISAITTGEI